MKQILCALMALMILSMPALAETSIIEYPEIIIETILPAPSPEPAGETFSSEDLIVTLPAGLQILEGAERAGYDAALQADYPDAAQTLLAAASADRSAALIFALSASDDPAPAAAREAAERILGSEDEVFEATLGENSYAGFDCAAGPAVLRLYFLSDGSRLLVIGAMGLENQQIETMLTGLNF